MGNGTRNNGCVMKILDGELIETLFDNNLKILSEYKSFTEKNNNNTVGKTKLKLK